MITNLQKAYVIHSRAYKETSLIVTFLTEKKGKITLQTGYGPSGLPHIGTFGEVARTSMIVNALKHLTNLPTDLSGPVRLSLMPSRKPIFEKG